MWFLRTNNASEQTEMLHISSRESREWMHEQMDARLQKIGLLMTDFKPEMVRADMAYLRKTRLLMEHIKSGTISAIIKTIIGGALGFIGWAILIFLGEIK